MITIPDAMRRPAEVERDELKKQLAEARADAEHWKSECNALQRMVHEARAEIERLKGVIISQITPEPLVLSSYSATTEPAKDERDKLIEQMRAALKIAAPCVKEIFGYHSKDYVEIKAALSAAERGE